MKILLFSHICCPTYITGAEKYLLFLISELIRNHICTLVVPHEGVLSVKARRIGVTIIIQPYPKITSIWRAGSTMQQELQQIMDSHLITLTHLLHMSNPDLVISNTCINPLPAVAAKKVGIPSMWIISEVITQCASTSQSVDLIDQYADFIVGISKTVVQPFQRKQLQQKTFILYPSWRMEDLQPGSWELFRKNKRAQMGVQSSHIWIGYISSDIVPLKGLEHFIQMGISLCRNMANIRLFIIGNATYQAFYANCLQMIQQSGFAERFLISGFENTIEEVYPAMDILVVPSLVDEGFGMTAMEGLIFGKPVVSYQSGGLIEIHNRTGNESFLVGKGNMAGLVDKVKQLVLDLPLRNRTGEHNSSAVIDAFGIQPYSNQLKLLMDAVHVRVDAIQRCDVMIKDQYPNGVLLKGSSAAVYLIEKGMKRPFVDGNSFYFYKYKWDRVLIVNDQVLRRYPTGNAINQAGHFIPGSPSTLLVKGSASSIYLWTNGHIHPIASPSIFTRLKYVFADVVHLPDTLIDALPIGYLINDDVLKLHELIDGKLYGAPTGGRYYSDNHQLRPVINHNVLHYFKWKEEEVIHLTKLEFNKASTGLPIALPTG
jgi:glycosyltransferase involved in cell wall biosynthesis